MNQYWVSKPLKKVVVDSDKLEEIVIINGDSQRILYTLAPTGVV
jgi:hypothetical protein